MKLGNAATIKLEDFPDAPDGEYFGLLVDRINSNNEQTTQCLRQNVTIADNMNAAIVTKRFTHGVELSIPVPQGVKGRPVIIEPGRSTAVNGGTRYRVASFDWRFIDSPDPKAPQQIGVTAYFDQPTTTYIGEKVRSAVASGSAVSILNNATTTITSISLTAGEWDISAGVQFTGSLTGTASQIHIATTTNSTTGAVLGDSWFTTPTVSTAGSHVGITVPSYAVSPTATTVYYLTATCSFTAGTCTAYGRISATRTKKADAAVQNDVTLVVYGG